MLVSLILDGLIQLLFPGALLVICAEEQHPRVALHVTVTVRARRDFSRAYTYRTRGFSRISTRWPSTIATHDVLQSTCPKRQHVMRRTTCTGSLTHKRTVAMLRSSLSTGADVA